MDIADIIISERAKIALRWISASLAIAVLTFLITVFYIYKYRSTKAASITGGTAVYVLAFLISQALTITSILDRKIRIHLSTVLVSISLLFILYFTLLIVS